MLIAVIILAWLLLNTWLALAFGFRIGIELGEFDLLLLKRILLRLTLVLFDFAKDAFFEDFAFISL